MTSGFLRLIATALVCGCLSKGTVSATESAADRSATTTAAALPNTKHDNIGNTECDTDTDTGASATCTNNSTLTKEAGASASKLSAVPLFECPKHIAKAENDFDDYWSTYLEMNDENMADLSNFRYRGYDYRAHSYTKMKELTRMWKQDYMADVLTSGDHIYESACGEGLNLLLTLEILRECCDITNLTVHGNDYLDESVQVAHAIYQHELQAWTQAQAAKPQDEPEEEFWFHEGVFCQGDSTNLSHVPSNAFELAYTGFLDPLLDPLQLMDDNADMDEKVGMIEEICEDPSLEHIAEQVQKAQEDWHHKWVIELIRIVKPGHYVIIEDVGWPACSFITEWGGVDPTWWRMAVDRYGWDVDVDSVQVVTESPHVWYGNRYNVRMRKNGAPRKPLMLENEEEEQEQAEPVV